MLRFAAWVINPDISKERSVSAFQVLRGSDNLLFDAILLVVIRDHRRSLLQNGSAFYTCLNLMFVNSCIVIQLRK